MKQTLDLNSLGLASMNEFEMQEVDGGNLLPVLRLTASVLALLMKS